MDPETDKLRLFVNPFAIWTDLALKTGAAMWATAHAAAVRASGPRIAVIPTADAPQEKIQAADPAAALMASAHAAALRNAKAAVIPIENAPSRKPRAPVAPKTKAARFKAARAKARSQARGRSKTGAQRRAKR